MLKLRIMLKWENNIKMENNVKWRIILKGENNVKMGE
jgi:hypothetical protein